MYSRLKIPDTAFCFVCEKVVHIKTRTVSWKEWNPLTGETKYIDTFDSDILCGECEGGQLQLDINEREMLRLGSFFANKNENAEIVEARIRIEGGD